MRDKSDVNCEPCTGNAGSMRAQLCATATHSTSFKEKTHSYYEIVPNEFGAMSSAFEDDTSGFSESLFISAMIKVGDRLVISPTNSNTYCFDAYTGSICWKETDSASSPQNMVHHNGIIYTAGRGNGI